MEQILESEGKKNKKEPFSVSDYKEEACMCAYMHQYCVYNSSIVMSLFTNMLDEKADIKKDLLSKNEIRICCLGGGSATEAVGIGLAIEHELRDEDNKVVFCVSVIDECPSWRRVVRNVEKAANKMKGKVNWKFQFIEKDILEPLCSEAVSRIRKADCITMVNFSSSVFSKRTVKKHVIREKFEEILKLAKSEAMIFYLDNSDDHYDKELECITHKFSNLLKVYRQQECFGRQTFCKDTKNLKKSFYDESLKEHYLKDFSSVAAAVWIKRDYSKSKVYKDKRDGTKPKVFLTVNKRDPKQPVPFNRRKLLLLPKGSTLSKFIDKRSEQFKKEHKYKDAARSSSRQKARYAADEYD
ncbi:uncharacterized protein LOC129226001 [Uloborus diversus]|uniref:uncharacterized protein LOC129226001 n=1 Tax=Uloborus diversus TaxID=327109 RepID=UPI0024094813|nr:uncharacterized protein LOC129226001 [Uloborus diversus]